MESTLPPRSTRRPVPGQAPDDDPQGHTLEFTRTAFQALGLTAPQAAQAAAEGGAMLNGTLVSVAPLPIGGLTGKAADDLYMVTVETSRRVEDLNAKQVATMLAHGPGLLAVHRATLGCLPDGRIVLHRTLDAASATPQDLANAMHTAQQLVQLLWGDGNAPQQQ
jgi:hypothetical protein